MQDRPFHREQQQDGSILLTAARCSFAFKRLAPGRLLVTISGFDQGQFGTATLDEISAEFMRCCPVEVYVDAREAVGVAVEVSREWTTFFARNRDKLKRVTVLVNSKFVHLTVSIAQHLSQTGNLIQIVADPQEFQQRLQHVQ